MVRISHTESIRLNNNVLWVQVGQWRTGDAKSLTGSFLEVLHHVHLVLGDVLCPRLQQRFKQHGIGAAMILAERAVSFTEKVVAAMGRNTSQEVSKYLDAEGFCPSEADKVLVAIPRGICIEQRLQPYLCYLSSLGLSKPQVANAAARSPHLLDCRIERNLKPAVQWLVNLGLTKAQVARLLRGLLRFLAAASSKT